jgi:RNA polymerase sigma factor (sigma-70 family)
VEQATRGTSVVPAPRRRRVRPATRGLPRRLLRGLGDERLVALLRAGDGGAFEAIYDRYHAPILSFCRHMLGSRSGGEDAAQQTFLAAYRNIVESSNPIKLRPWLYAIARNYCVSQLRARRETPGIDEAGADLPDTDGLVEQVQRRDDLRALLGDLAALPDEQRAALVLSELGDLSHREIAGVLDCEPGHVKALVYQARSSLMADRKARELDCTQIREQLAVARGHELLRGGLRRHLRSCEGCREFAADVKRQRRALAVMLPVIPTLAFRHETLAPILGSAGGGLAPAGSVVGAAGKSFALKALVAAVAAAGISAGVAVVRHGHATPVSRAHPRSARPIASPRPHPARNRHAATHTRAKPGGAPAAHRRPSAHGNTPAVSIAPGFAAVPYSRPVAPSAHAPGRALGHTRHSSHALGRHARPQQRSPAANGRRQRHDALQRTPGASNSPASPRRGGRKPPPTARKSLAPPSVSSAHPVR